MGSIYLFKTIIGHRKICCSRRSQPTTISLNFLMSCESNSTLRVSGSNLVRGRIRKCSNSKMYQTLKWSLCYMGLNLLAKKESIIHLVVRKRKWARLANADFSLSPWTRTGRQGTRLRVLSRMYKEGQGREASRRESPQERTTCNYP